MAWLIYSCRKTNACEPKHKGKEVQISCIINANHTDDIIKR
jgi:hypothetical protein